MKKSPVSKEISKKKKINLALQGGGSHGAFTWGVLDELLRDGRVHFEGITATSAGSMNAAIMIYGLHKNGVDGACQLLEKFWHKVSQAGSVFNPLSQVNNTYLEKMFPWVPKQFLSPAAGMNYLENISQTISPYRSNPYDINPLRDILDELIDFDVMKTCYEGKLLITATNVHIGQARIFKNDEITLDVLMASACLPYIFKAVDIEGHSYWDGGYSGNPALWPLYYESTTPDLLIVHVNPIIDPTTPKEAFEIENRLNEITFNSPMLQEFRAIQFVQKLLDDDMLKPEFRNRYKNIHLHAIRAEEVMREQGASSKYDTSWDFLVGLRDAGRKMAKDWLEKNYDSLGKKSTVDIQKEYLDPQYKLNSGALPAPKTTKI